jgi:hypothetical protein
MDHIENTAPIVACMYFQCFLEMGLYITVFIVFFIMIFISSSFVGSGDSFI